MIVTVSQEELPITLHQRPGRQNRINSLANNSRQRVLQGASFDVAILITERGELRSEQFSRSFNIRVDLNPIFGRTRLYISSLLVVSVVSWGSLIKERKS